MAITSILDHTVDGFPTAVPQHMSEEEFVAWAMGGEFNAEWVNGEVILMSPAAMRHVEIGNWLMQVLGIYIRSRKLGKLLGPEFMIRLEHSGVSRRVPDVLFVANENLNKLQTNHLDGSPDLAIEIVSPDSRVRDLKDKFVEYETSGVREYWIIDSKNSSLKAFVLNAEGKYNPLDLDANGVLRSLTVSGFWIKPSWLWQDELPDPMTILRELGIRN